MFFQVRFKNKPSKILEEGLLSCKIHAPFIFFHLKFFHYPLSEDNSSSIANEDIQDNVVPPTFLQIQSFRKYPEIREPMSECDFKKLEGDLLDHG